MQPKDVAGIAYNVDPDQTAPQGAVWSGSALYGQTYLSENLGTLWLNDIWTLFDIAPLSAIFYAKNVFVTWCEMHTISK